MCCGPRRLLLESDMSRRLDNALFAPDAGDGRMEGARVQTDRRLDEARWR
jgi:hypothetical protein